MHQALLPESEAIIVSNTKVSIDGLADAINEGLKEYADLAADDMKSAVKKVGATVRKQIQSSAPKDTGKYAKSWSVKP